MAIPLTPEARETLRKLAEKATPWTESDDCARWDPNPNGPDEYIAGPHRFECLEHVNGMGVMPPEAEDTAAYIAAAHPAAILALLSALDEAEKRIEHLEMSGIHSCHEGCQRVTCVLRRERDAAQATAKYNKTWAHELLAERDSLAAELSKGNAAYEQLLHEREETEKLLQLLLNKVNRVTATWRHRQETWPSDLDELTERQIQVEQAHKTLNKHADDDAAGGLK